MDKLLYTVTNGAQQTMDSQTIRMHNLANVDTIGFRASLEHVQGTEVAGGRLSSRVHVRSNNNFSDFKQGPMVTTGRDLDVALNTEGWLAVQTKEGKEAYSRAGGLQINGLLQLTNAEGNLVLGDGGPIVIPEAEKVTIGPDGSITVQPKGQGPDTVATIGRLKLVEIPNEVLARGSEGYFYRTDGLAATQPSPNVTVSAGVLEGSNVNPMQTLTEIVMFARQYEIQMNMIQKAQDIASRETQLMNMRS